MHTNNSFNTHLIIHAGVSYDNLEQAGFDFNIEDDVLRLGIPNIIGKSTDSEAHNKLPKAFRAAKNSDARVVVMTGKGEGPFYSDADTMPVEDFEQFHQIMDETEDFLEDLLNIEQPVISKVGSEGAHTVGASVALGADFVVASKDASFSDMHVPYGVAAGDGGCVMWPARIGVGRAKEYLLTGKPISAEKAEEIGLITRAVPEEELDDEVDELAEELASKPPIGMQFTKKALNQYYYQNMLISGRYAAGLEGFSFSGPEWQETLAALYEEGEGIGNVIRDGDEE